MKIRGKATKFIQYCDRVSPIVGTATAEQELLRSHVAMGTLSPRGRHSEVASTTTDDEDKADWPAGGQRPGIPQEEAANEEAANEEEGAAIENGGATSEEKGGGNGRRGEPHNPEDNPEDGGRPRCPGTCDDDARGSGVVPEPEGTREQRGDHHRASHGPGGSWLWKVRSLWTNRGAP
ncbi:hypothetical protein NDU88_005930 [Pleurodeles waltl]|uniref:Uncharacterized protein n=1 Tax=Pleurodeles waltl TaxID=8319 RepID=A0AAV7RQI3_PLEWA|nr:hypothetical protein NDU88_005930 [Pleurodeles waltl]